MDVNDWMPSLESGNLKSSPGDSLGFSILVLGVMSILFDL